MWQLYHFALCPFSRKVRLLLSEKQIGFELVDVMPWERQPVFSRVNHSGLTPVLRDRERGLVLADSGIICEFIEETDATPSMMPGSAEQRTEIRRLVAWGDECLYAPVNQKLLIAAFGSGRHGAAVSQPTIDEVIVAAGMYLDELGHLLDRRSWLAGSTLSLADLAIAAHLSVADYLGAIDWAGHHHVHTWYAALKSRRSFQPLLADRIEGIEPPRHYAEWHT